MMYIQRLRRSAILIGGACLAAFGAQAANDFTIQSGTWVVTSEVNGQPGRGMAIDVQDDTLVLAVYNYESSGQPTFHLASSAMSGPHFSGELIRYKNGRYYGSGPLDGEQDSSAGTVKIDFDSAATGTIQFPGEQPAAISRFKFDGIGPSSLTRPNVNERWLLAEINGKNQVTNALLVDASTSTAMPGGYLPSVQSFKDGQGHSSACQSNIETGAFKCTISFDGKSLTRTLEWYKHLEGMSGNISIVDISPVQKTRVVGMRLGIDYGAAAPNAQMDSPTAAMTPPFYFVAPDPGIWVATPELTGKPGRGMSIDVQSDRLALAVYNYETSGAPTFHLASDTYYQNSFSGHLIRYEGGRYYGGPAQSAHEVADAGQASIELLTPTQGTIQFPGEQPAAIQRYRFGALAPTPESLFGGWMIFDPQQKELHYYTLNAVDSSSPTVATGTGAMLSIRCNYPGSGAAEAVKCTDQTFVSVDNYNFTPVNGRAIGSHDGSGGGGTSTIYVLRVQDRHGNLAGLGKF